MALTSPGRAVHTIAHRGSRSCAGNRRRRKARVIFKRIFKRISYATQAFECGQSEEERENGY